MSVMNRQIEEKNALPFSEKAFLVNVNPGSKAT
jgi:hypothetical protein